MSEKLVIRKILEFGFAVFCISTLYVLSIKIGNILLIAPVGAAVYLLGDLIESRKARKILLAAAFLGLGIFFDEIRVSAFLTSAGVLFNYLIIVLNGMKMPTPARVFETADPIEQERYAPINEKTKLRFLGDILQLRDPTMAFSIGDVLFVVGSHASAVEVYLNTGGGF
ncbi:MAG: DUF5317 family protein [Candidatus Giovannonibacteria bacterium]|nr:MAG: DUF5317 family protein [Candidatus Giovannonibacteria bacterium]